jgi:hypothetical protein
MGQESDDAPLTRGACENSHFSLFAHVHSGPNRDLGHVKSGQRRSGQNRPTEVAADFPPASVHCRELHLLALSLAVNLNRLA